MLSSLDVFHGNEIRRFESHFAALLAGEQKRIDILTIYRNIFMLAPATVRVTAFLLTCVTSLVYEIYPHISDIGIC